MTDITKENRETFRSAVKKAEKEVIRCFKSNLAGEEDFSPSEIEENALDVFISHIRDYYAGSKLFVVSEDADSFFEIGEETDEVLVCCIDPIDQTEKTVNGDFSQSSIGFWGGKAVKLKNGENELYSLVEPIYSVVCSLDRKFLVEAFREGSNWEVRAEGSLYGDAGESFDLEKGDVSDRITGFRENLFHEKYKLASDYQTKPSRSFHNDSINNPLTDENIRVDSNGGAIYQFMVATGQNHIGFESEPTMPTEASGGIIAEALGVERIDITGKQIDQISVIFKEQSTQETFHEVVWNNRIFEDIKEETPLELVDVNKHIKESREKGKEIKELDKYFEEQLKKYSKGE